MLDSRPPMDSELEKLVRLQELDKRIAQLNLAIAALPARLQSSEQKLEAQKRLLAEAEKAALAEEARRRRLESDLKDRQYKLAKLREQSSSVKTNEQFHALQHEIGFVEAGIEKIEDEELASMVESESLERRRAEARAGLAAEAESVADEQQSARVESARQQEEMDGLAQERTLLRRGVDPELLAQYDRIATSSKKTALARASGQRCLTCQMALRPQYWNQVRDGSLLNCESCGRMLYFDPRLETAG